GGKPDGRRQKTKQELAQGPSETAHRPRSVSLGLASITRGARRPHFRLYLSNTVMTGRALQFA
ncbi:MAG: hypothetical protein OEW56_10555, partial [Gemmatimonadota bacterium]|nr:hypothetical protein [Gemmatimonadota bacterium]